jgi:hypothetical protein
MAYKSTPKTLASGELKEELTGDADLYLKVQGRVRHRHPLLSGTDPAATGTASQAGPQVYPCEKAHYSGQRQRPTGGIDKA